jgi:threonine/homoserine/homoserine lactone efflux protein
LNPETLAFVGVAVAVSVVPGPDMALVARNTLLGGRRAGAATVAGVAGGLVLWSVFAVVGIAALLATSAVLFAALKLLGAAYLIYLGIATLRSGSRDPHQATGPAPLSLSAAAAQGFVSAGLNPKLGVLFLTLLPQFTGATATATPVRSLELAAVFGAIGVSWLLLYTWLIGAARDVLARPGPQRALRWLTGGVLIGLGARVAVERA